MEIKHFFIKIRKKVKVWLNPAIESMRLFFKPKKGSLSSRRIVSLALKNLVYGRSRTIVTIGAIALGAGAIVFLVSFGYGLQEIVTQKLVQPNSMRLADVQSDSTSLALTAKTVKEIKKISGVEDLAVAVSLAGSVGYKNSKMDVVVVGVSNKFLEYAHQEPLEGELFSKKAEKKYVANCFKTDCPSDLEQLADLMSQSKEEKVLGAATQSAKINIGDPVNNKTIRYRIDNDQYLPLRDSPKMTAKIIGYVKSDLTQSYSGVEVWGSPYKSVSTKGKSYQDQVGNWYGLWLKTKVSLYKQSMSDVFEPLTDENGGQQKHEGYLVQEGVKILSDEDLLLEKQLDKLYDKFNVLGESTSSAQATSSAPQAIALEKTATETSQLKKIVASQREKEKKTAIINMGLVEVKKKGGKEIIVSTGFLNALKLKPKDIVNKQIELTYIISGGMIPKTAGRVLSKPVKYKIIGVIDNKKKSMVFVPIADVESLGVKKYTMAKVLAVNNQSLKLVREKIESIGFATRSIVDTLVQVDRLFKVMRFLLGAFGAIALIVAIFGMFNTLTVSLLERTREIAVMKTLGTTDVDVVRLFITESLIIGILGGILGIFVGVFVGKIINLAFRIFQHTSGINLFVSPVSFLIIVLFLSVAVGFLTGIYPSYRAKKISPLDALRYE